MAAKSLLPEINGAQVAGARMRMTDSSLTYGTDARGVRVEASLAKLRR